MNMKYWTISGNVAKLNRQVRNVNHKLINFSFNNVAISGIRFLISTDMNLTVEEQQELLYVI